MRRGRTSLRSGSGRGKARPAGLLPAGLAPTVLRAAKPESQAGPPARQEPPESSANEPDDGFNETELEERFGEQEFRPEGGFVVRAGQRLPVLVWEHPDLVAKVVDDPTIPTRWFNDRFEEVKTAHEPGRYYAYGEAPAPSP